MAINWSERFKEGIIAGVLDLVFFGLASEIREKLKGKVAEPIAESLAAETLQRFGKGKRESLMKGLGFLWTQGKAQKLYEELGAVKAGGRKGWLENKFVNVLSTALPERKGDEEEEDYLERVVAVLEKIIEPLAQNKKCFWDFMDGLDHNVTSQHLEQIRQKAGSTLTTVQESIQRNKEALQQWDRETGAKIRTWRERVERERAERRVRRARLNPLNRFRRKPILLTDEVREEKK